MPCFFVAENQFSRTGACLCAYMCTLRAQNMRIYAKYMIKSSIKRLTHVRTHAII